MSDIFQQRSILLQKQTNGLAVAGFCLMILGWLTCGILCVPAMIVCGVAMFYDPPGLAIAGFILSIPGVVGLILWVAMLISGGIVFTAVANEASQPKSKQAISRPVGR